MELREPCPYTLHAIRHLWSQSAKTIILRAVRETDDAQALARRLEFELGEIFNSVRAEDLPSTEKHEIRFE